MCVISVGTSENVLWVASNQCYTEIVHLNVLLQIQCSSKKGCVRAGVRIAADGRSVVKLFVAFHTWALLPAPELPPPLPHCRCTRTRSHLRLEHKHTITHELERTRGPYGHRRRPVPFSPRFLRQRSRWSLSWIRTCLSLGWSLMKGCFRSWSVGGRCV